MHLLALKVTAADERERARVASLAEAAKEAAGESVEPAYVDQGYAGGGPAEAVRARGIEVCVVKHAEAKRGFVPLSRRWVVERSFARAARFRRLARDCERRAETLAGRRWLAFAGLTPRSLDGLDRENA